ncbi:uncharacterized protein LACBIDRAFT_308707 [Laccaria bicolor S238N-H82]|uniref:Predicted protein n=1 Tax=Laccaria bicolor (strain S238N-H82 / ATCC MYA-4686) TaxID=486041 RepID=B0CX04_LACBS|nr:uncharacterized protein LACBIDRAFT_308707 [Laccaria bicolor S238N-H82]EDR13162.1 predicted protein [Laccaria bicolor S238N-H82]|eukprot:XP_001875660.1 predicted protein [Laccaria bicolor S238N-H82]
MTGISSQTYPRGWRVYPSIYCYLVIILESLSRCPSLSTTTTIQIKNNEPDLDDTWFSAPKQRQLPAFPTALKIPSSMSLVTKFSGA